MKIVSWNINGIRACVQKGSFFDYLHEHDPDILFLQETKAQVSQLPEEVVQPLSYFAEWASGDIKGYSGVAILTKKKPLAIIHSLDIPHFDCEGRVIGAEFEDKVILGVYFPNSQRPGRLDYKREFYKAFFKKCDEYRQAGKHVIVSGDFNTAHTAIDLARPDENAQSAGFLPIERDDMTDLLTTQGYVDTFRHFHPNEPNHYSWWTYRAGARQRNIGWRIDYVLVNKEFLPHVQTAFIQPDVKGSDHCPVGIVIN